MQYADNSAIGRGIGSASDEYAKQAQVQRIQVTQSQQAKTGLVLMAEQIADAATRINQISDGLGSLSIGLHGPRPEPVAGENTKAVTADSLQSRIHALLESVDRLQRSYEGVVR